MLKSLQNRSEQKMLLQRYNVTVNHIGSYISSSDIKSMLFEHSSLTPNSIPSQVYYGRIKLLTFFIIPPITNHSRKTICYGGHHFSPDFWKKGT